MTPCTQVDWLKHRIWLVDPTRRWMEPLSRAVAAFPCQIDVWQPNYSGLLTGELLNGPRWEGEGATRLVPCAVLYHCLTANTKFLEAWFRAEFIHPLPPLIALLDSPDASAADALRQLGCVQIQAGFHNWDHLVKTLRELTAGPVRPQLPLENLIAANLPWGT